MEMPIETAGNFIIENYPPLPYFYSTFARLFMIGIRIAVINRDTMGVLDYSLLLSHIRNKFTDHIDRLEENRPPRPGRGFYRCYTDHYQAISDLEAGDSLLIRSGFRVIVDSRRPEFPQILEAISTLAENA